MARSKSGGVNKSAEIREALKQNPKAKSREIVDQLAARGIKVAPSLVYMVKSHDKRRQRRLKRERATTASKALGIANPIDLIVKVKELSREAGGISHLKRLVDVLAE